MKYAEIYKLIKKLQERQIPFASMNIADNFYIRIVCDGLHVLIIEHSELYEAQIKPLEFWDYNNDFTDWMTAEDCLKKIESLRKIYKNG